MTCKNTTIQALREIVNAARLQAASARRICDTDELQFPELRAAVAVWHQLLDQAGEQAPQIWEMILIDRGDVLLRALVKAGSDVLEKMRSLDIPQAKEEMEFFNALFDALNTARCILAQVEGVDQSAMWQVARAENGRSLLRAMVRASKESLARACQFESPGQEPQNERFQTLKKAVVEAGVVLARADCQTATPAAPNPLECSTQPCPFSDSLLKTIELKDDTALVIASIPETLSSESSILLRRRLQDAINGRLHMDENVGQAPLVVLILSGVNFDQLSRGEMRKLGLRRYSSSLPSWKEIDEIPEPLEAIREGIYPTDQRLAVILLSTYLPETIPDLTIAEVLQAAKAPADARVFAANPYGFTTEPLIRLYLHSESFQKVKETEALPILATIHTKDEVRPNA